ncbi:Ldh family oxidoreductase [Paenarthrobacter nicotinovorans]|uniref:Ldh family oxidoreductase n=1 Tax=Paenarthrobacter nicotinovorans TaxID=29320 RepID=UPI003802434B
MRYPIDQVREVATAALCGAGVDADHAEIQVQHLIDGELRGHPSHGLLRLPRIIARIHNGVIDPHSKGTHTWTGDALLRVDGGDGLGPVVAYQALAALAERAQRTGIAVAAISRANHLGMLAQYAEAAAQDGWVALMLTTSEALVHPWGGRRALIGTNPVAIAVPAEPEPLVLDMATGIISMGKIHAHAAIDRPLQEGWALDAEGEPTTDAKAAVNGAITPFGGPKGYALGLAFEVLVGALTDTALGTDVHGTLDDDRTSTKGDVLILARPGTGTAARIGAYLDILRAEKPQEGSAAVTVPGDRARAARDEHITTGLELNDELWDRLVRLSNLKGIEQ